MIWQRSGEMGMISEPYRVGKFAVNDHLAYRLWCGTELLGEFPSSRNARRRRNSTPECNR